MSLYNFFNLKPPIMLNLINILLVVGMTSIFSVNTPVEPTNPITTKSVIDAPLETCNIEVLQSRLAAYYGVPNEFITIAPNLANFTIKDQLDNQYNGFLHYDVCGKNCTMVTAKSDQGSTVFQMPCDMGTKPAGNIPTTYQKQ